MAVASRFLEVSKELLDNLLDNSIPEKTKRATKYGMKIFNGKFSGLLLLFVLQLRVKQNYELFFIIEWFASQTKFKTGIQEMAKEELNECVTMFYAAVRRGSKCRPLKQSGQPSTDTYTGKFGPFTDFKKVNQIFVKSLHFLCKLRCL